MASRTATITRTTKETDISLTLEIDGTGKTDIDTGIPFFDHMLDAFARHGLFDLTVKAKGDLEVDAHHTVEDVGIVLGQALAEAMGNKLGITRFASQAVPMDEALVMAALDISGRGQMHFDILQGRERTSPDRGGLQSNGTRTSPSARDRSTCSRPAPQH